MKAAVLHEFNAPLIIEEIEIDPPQAGEVKVKLAACAICHSDIHSMEGAWGGRLPVVYGHEAAGIVTEVGAGVHTVQVGDPVVVTLVRSCGHCFHCTQGESYICEGSFALNQETRLHDQEQNDIRQGILTGAFAEDVVVEQSQVVGIPADVPLDSAALLACGVITGFGAVVNTAQVKPGSSVVVIGVGGVGLNSIQGAALSGANPIIAVDLLDNKLEAARTFGATHTLNPTQVERPDKQIKAWTSGRGADYVFVTVGSSRAVEQGVTMVRRGGTLTVVGMAPSGVNAGIEMVNLAYNNIRVLGSNMGSTRLQIDIPYLVRLYQNGQLKLDELITARYPLEEINEAIAAVTRGEALRNVIVFD